MRLIMIIADDEYREQVEAILAQSQCHGTQIASTGAFLQYGESIYLIGLTKSSALALIQRFQQVFSSAQHDSQIHVRLYMMKMKSWVKGEGGSIIYDHERNQGA